MSLNYDFQFAYYKIQNNCNLHQGESRGRWTCGKYWENQMMFQKQVLSAIAVIQIVVRYGKKTTGKYVLAPKTCTLTSATIVTTQLNLVIQNCICMYITNCNSRKGIHVEWILELNWSNSKSMQLAIYYNSNNPKLFVHLLINFIRCCIQKYFNFTRA
jgi:hypothetical protein